MNNLVLYHPMRLKILFTVFIQTNETRENIFDDYITINIMVFLFVRTRIVIIHHKVIH